MAKLPLPERGQPLDVTYIYPLADTVNNLSTQVSSASYNYTTIDTASALKQSVKTSDNSIVTAATEKSFSYDFVGDFKYPPIVSATIINTGNTSAGANVSVVLKKPTTSRVEGVVRYGANGNLSIDVHLVIVGIPN